MNTDTVMNNTTEVIVPSVAVKVTRGDEMRRFNFQGKTFQELKNTVAGIFDIPVADFSLQYEDDEKDRVTLSSDAELKEAIQLHKYVLRFFVTGTNKQADAADAGDLPSPVPAPHYHHHHRHHHGHHHGVASPPPHVIAVSAEGEVSIPPHGPHQPAMAGRHGRHGHGPYGHGRPFGGPHKRCLDKEEREAMKCEKKRWKKQRKCESSSSSSSSEDEAQKLQRKEMKQLIKATKMSIKATWVPTKQSNPAQWPENRKLMITEIKMAKRLIREQARKSTAPAVSVTEQNAPVVTLGAEMQA